MGNDRIVLTGSDTPANYQAALRAITYVNTSENPSTVNRPVTFSATDTSTTSGSDTRTISVSSVDDPPVAVNDFATVLEEAAATSIPVLTNDSDVDGGPKTITSATDPDDGTVVLTGGSPGAHTGLTYQPDPDYCNDPSGIASDTFTYTIGGGSSATVSMTVTCVNDAPVADNETFNGNDSTHGNTTMVVNDPDDGAPSPTQPKTTVSGDILAGDTDIDGPGPLTVTSGTFATNDGGSVTVEADGDFTFRPAASTSCTDTSDFFDYTVEDSGAPEQTDVGRVTIAIAGCVWYVNNNAAGNSGTSSQPFDTLVQAETASGNNHTVFVFDGDNASTGYDAGGYAMNSGERLIGEHEGLEVDPDQDGALNADTLHAANPGAHPTLTANNTDVIDLDDGNEIRGVNIDPQGTGGGIFGGAGDTGGTIDDVNVADTGTAGSQASLELNGTNGSFVVTDLAINNKATGVLLNNAGTADFGTTTIISDGAPGLSATGTNMNTSSFDAITTMNSGTGGVVLTDLTGATNVGDGLGTDLNLTTASGATAGFKADNVTGLSVGAAGTDDVNATGGPAVDVTFPSVPGSPPVLDFDQLQSTNSSTDGINLDTPGTGTFSASPTSNIVGTSGIAFDLNSGSGAISYPGSVNNGTGSTVEITNRSGGAVTFVGTIFDNNDAGGGINMTGNTGGSTTFSNASKTLNTQAGHAVVFNNSDGHTLTFSGGGLDVDTTSGKGIEASTSGTLTVSGSANTIDSTTGRALNVVNTDIGNNDLTFLRIASNGAASGIVLNNTANSGGDLAVTGNGGTCTSTASCTGGAIQNSTGSGVDLTSVPGNVSLTRTAVTNSDLHGIRASSATGGIALETSVVLDNGDASNENGLEYTNVHGVTTIRDTKIANSAANNARIDNSSGTMHLTVANSDFENSDPGLTGSGNDGLLIDSDTNAVIRSNITGSRFKFNKGDGFQVNSDGGGGDLSSHQHTFTGNTIEGRSGTNTDGGIVISPSGAVTRVNVSNNTITNTSVSALILNPGPASVSTAEFDAIANNNTIGTNGVADSGSVDGDGLQVKSATDGSARIAVTNNIIRNFDKNGLYLRASEAQQSASDTTQLTATGNQISQPDPAHSETAIQLTVGTSSASDVVTACS